MSKSKGFTLIELMITMVMISIVAMIILNIKNHGLSLGGLNGVVCKAGVQFNRDINGYEQQIIGVDGRPIGC